MEKEEQIFRNRMRELAETAYRRDIPTHTGFLNLNEQTVFCSAAGSFPPVKYEMTGGYEAAERKVVCFLPSYEEVLQEPPCDCLKLSAKQKKFAEELNHRDYLGAVMSLGIQREVIGDIMVSGTDAYIFVLKTMSSYLLEHLVSVRHTSVSAELCRDLSSLPPPAYTEVQGSVSSLRLDALTALAGRISRTKALELIEGEKVFINGQLMVSASRQVREGDILSVRGLGKFRFAGEGATTKKGRTMVTLWQYK